MVSKPEIIKIPEIGDKVKVTYYSDHYRRIDQAIGVLLDKREGEVKLLVGYVPSEWLKGTAKVLQKRKLHNPSCWKAGQKVSMRVRMCQRTEMRIPLRVLMDAEQRDLEVFCVYDPCPTKKIDFFLDEIKYFFPHPLDLQPRHD